MNSSKGSLASGTRSVKVQKRPGKSLRLDTPLEKCLQALKNLKQEAILETEELSLEDVEMLGNVVTLWWCLMS